MVTIRTRREKDKSRKEKANILSKHEQAEEYLITTHKDKQRNKVNTEAKVRYSVPREDSMIKKAPRPSVLSSSSDDNRETAASAIDRPAMTVVDLQIEEEKIEIEF